ncbi:MAG: right-handed parallel beta-helix repeat-containing protein [Acidobacteria bacterium]|nr:right-handed parallel beta-helix repeat-containing protein [Acidobacteriota bacterium]
MIRIWLWLCIAAPAQPATYYVDAAQGRDAAQGTTPSSAWQSLAKVNAAALSAGDRILLKSGSRWSGQLIIPSSGAPGKPIVVSRYGDGALPRIDGEGRVENTLHLRNAEYVELRDLEITNLGGSRALRRGVYVELEDFGDARGIVLSGLYVHDVNGIQSEKGNGGIILRIQGGRKPTRFDGLLVEKNIVWKVDRTGIVLQSHYWPRERWHPSRNVVVRDNLVEDIGGDGIVVWACDGARVEHNISRDANRRADSFNAGIWPWSSDNTLFQLNEASFTRTTKDGQGFDSDYNSRNTVFQYNYSHDNEGGFILICNDGSHPRSRSIGNHGTIVRHNISRNDRERIFDISGEATNTLIHDNAIYVGPGMEVQMLLLGNWGGWAKGAIFRNNAFLVEGGAIYGHQVKRDAQGRHSLAPGFGPAQDIVFEGNRYAGTHTHRPDDAKAIVEPAVKAPAFDWQGPRFDPASPAGFPEFLTAHRRWLIGLLEKHFPPLPR